MRLMRATGGEPRRDQCDGDGRRVVLASAKGLLFAPMPRPGVTMARRAYPATRSVAADPDADYHSRFLVVGATKSFTA
jgi:hypothetical protein